MDSSNQAATILALEAATDALMAAMRRRPDPDLEAAAAAFKAREGAIRMLVASDPKERPPDMNARIRQILDCDREAVDQLRAEMDSLRQRLASTRQMMDNYRKSRRGPEEVR
jgi:site-specific recombinase